MSNNMSDDDIAHLAGAFDAAGSIRVQISKEESYALDYRYSPVVRFYRPMNDPAMLGKIDAYCEEHGVKYSVAMPEEGNTDEFIWRVSDTESIERFLEPLMPWLVVNYEPAMIMLDAILPGVRDEKHRTRGGFLTMMSMADQLRDANDHGPAPKYTREFFEDLWEEEMTA